MVFNPISCAGWATKATGWVATGDCFKIRIGLVILFFVICLARKWGGEEMGINFSFFFSLLLGLFSYLLTAVLFGSFKISFIVGIVLALVGGYGGGLVGLGGDDDGGYE